MTENNGNSGVATGAATAAVGDAVGMPSRQWYVAIVGNNTEKQCAMKLQKLGFESYVPTQTEMRQWHNGKRNTVERIVLPAVVFVHTTETERRTVVVRQPYVKRFFTDRGRKADQYGKHPVAVIPDVQIRRLMFILDNADSDVLFDTSHIKLGDRVRIVRGGLIGLEGNVVRGNDGATYFAVSIDLLGVAKVTVRREDLELINN